MEWSKDMTSHLIELYREKRVLWDPTLLDFKDRNKKHDAWDELGAVMNIDASEVEKKVRMLTGQFSRELKKGKVGDGEEAPYKSKWIFFKLLLFLKDKNTPRHSTEPDFSHVPSHQDIVQCILTENHGPPLNELHLEVQDSSANRQQSSVEKNIPRTSIKSTKRKAGAMSHAAYAVMRQLSSNVKNRDQFDVFGEYVANTLRNLKCRSIQSNAKFEISTVLYQAEITDHNQQSTLSGSSTPVSFDATPVPSNHSVCTENNDGNDT